MKLAVFISGTGTNMVAIHNAIKAGELDATIELIVSSNDHAKGIQYAQNEGLDLLVFTPADYDDPEAVDARIVEALNERDIDYVAMAGYMRKVTPVLLDAYPNRVVNLHPALLPAHRGAHAIQDAFEAGDEVTGITIHFANESTTRAQSSSNMRSPCCLTTRLMTSRRAFTQLSMSTIPRSCSG